MYDNNALLILVGVALVVALFVGLLVATTSAIAPDQDAIKAAMAAGKITYDMNKKQVLQVWGDPDALETKVTETPLGSRDRLTSVLEGLSQSRLERVLSGRRLFTYTVWTYHKPWRTVTFDEAGRVVDWFPKD